MRTVIDIISQTFEDCRNWISKLKSYQCLMCTGIYGYSWLRLVTTASWTGTWSSSRNSFIDLPEALKVAHCQSSVQIRKMVSKWNIDSGNGWLSLSGTVGYKFIGAGRNWWKAMKFCCWRVDKITYSADHLRILELDYKAWLPEPLFFLGGLGICLALGSLRFDPSLPYVSI